MHIVVFMTEGMSLSEWDRIGILDRETAILKSWVTESERVSLISYGGRGDLAYAERLPGIEIICNRWNLPRAVYLTSLRRRAKKWPGPVVIRSNQTPGAQYGLRTARAAGHTFIARCGYLYSLNTERAHGPNSPQAASARKLEKTVFTGADLVVVTSQGMQAEAVKRHDLVPEKVKVVPNYVQTDLFCPGSESTEVPGRICHVGRLSQEKNLGGLIEACQGLEVELIFVGDGPLREELKGQASELGVKAEFLGSMDHADLPEIMNSCQVYAQPSFYEGHPKALLEAMSCGRPVLAGNSPGIREVIEDGEDGLLSGHDPESIRDGLVTLLKDHALRTRLGRSARARVVRSVSLSRIVELESIVMSSVLDGTVGS